MHRERVAIVQTAVGHGHRHAAAVVAERLHGQQVRSAVARDDLGCETSSFNFILGAASIHNTESGRRERIELSLRDRARANASVAAAGFLRELRETVFGLLRFGSFACAESSTAIFEFVIWRFSLACCKRCVNFCAARYSPTARSPVPGFQQGLTFSNFATNASSAHIATASRRFWPVARATAAEAIRGIERRTIRNFAAGAAASDFGFAEGAAVSRLRRRMGGGLAARVGAKESADHNKAADTSHKNREHHRPD